MSEWVSEWMFCLTTVGKPWGHRPSYILFSYGFLEAKNDRTNRSRWGWLCCYGKVPSMQRRCYNILALCIFIYFFFLLILAAVLALSTWNYQVHIFRCWTFFMVLRIRKTQKPNLALFGQKQFQTVHLTGCVHISVAIFNWTERRITNSHVIKIS